MPGKKGWSVVSSTHFRSPSLFFEGAFLTLDHRPLLARPLACPAAARASACVLGRCPLGICTLDACVYGRWSGVAAREPRDLASSGPSRVPSPRSHLGRRVRRSGLSLSCALARAILHVVASPAAASRQPDVRARAAGLQQPYRACLSACGAAWNVTAADPRLLMCALSLAVGAGAHRFQGGGHTSLHAPPPP